MRSNSFHPHSCRHSCEFLADRMPERLIRNTGLATRKAEEDRASAQLKRRDIRRKEFMETAELLVQF